MTADDLKVGDRIVVELYGHTDGNKYPCGLATVDYVFPMVGGGTSFSFKALSGARRTGLIMPDDGSVWRRL